MSPDLFSRPGRFWRGNLHTHSNLSDGGLPPQEVCRRYADEGYDFMCLSDHMLGCYGYPIADTRAFRTNRFTTILGAEIHSGPMQNGELWHILAVGLPEDFHRPEVPGFRPMEGMESGPAIARRARAAGAFVAIAHPQWSGLTMEDARSIDAAHAVEIYNHGCHTSSARGDGFSVLDLLLTEGRRLTAIATDDAHFTEPDHFGGWVMVKSEVNAPEDLLDALKAGHFYSSQGPEFRGIEVEGDTVRVETSAVSTVIVQGRGIDTVARHGQSMTVTEIDAGRCASSPWIRVTITDSGGRRAWSNPIWRET